MKISKSVMAATIAMALSGVGVNVAQADQGDVLVRVRAIDVAPQASDSDKLKNNLGAKLGVTSEQTVEVDLSYFVLKNVALELIAATTNHDVTVNGGTAPLGTVGVLPPTLTAQYHFLPDSVFRPYVGAGINWTWFYDVKLPSGVTIDHSSFGPALQAGFDIQVTDKVFANVDVKKIWINTDVKSGGANIGTLDINPWVVGIGFGTKF